jgi:cellulose biosynthesis protein BcsQ
MAHGGGRGWFHRRKPQSEPEPMREPEPTRLEAYEAQQTGDRYRPTTPAEPNDLDSLLQPAMGSAVDPTPVTPSPTPSPEQPSGAANGSAATPDPDPRAAPTSSAPSSYDWDAATAAALSGETGPEVPHGPAPTLHHSDPDKLLEDIIREIVGDATAETVSSLNQPRPADSPEADARRVPVRVAETSRAQTAEYEDAEVDGRRYSVFDEPVTPDPVAPQAVTSAGARPVPQSQPEPEPLPAPEPQPESEPDPASEPAAPTDAPIPIPAPAPDTVTEPSAAAPSAAEPSAAGPSAAEPPADVSRETPDPNGGTPLADQIADETRRRLALEEAVLPLPASTRILTISNQKGGVGKTTSAVNLAAALARAGAKVLVIDLDPQGNASTALGVEHRSDQQSVYDVLVSDLPLGDVVRRSTEHDNLDCVPATIHLAGAEIELVSLVAREQRLRRALDAHLAEMDAPYDYVLIDCPPSLGLLTINAFVAAREVLIPIQCEYYALEGLSQLLSNVELIEKHLNPELRLSTILLTMYDSRTNLAQQVAQEVRDHFPTQTLGTIIPRSVRVSEAPSYGQSVISYDYASSGSLSYREAAAEIAWRNASEQKESD